jgi:hypothetical protein
MTKKFTSIEKILEFNSAYEKSGNPMAIFAAQSNLPLHTAQWYRTRAKNHLSQSADDSAEGFSLVPVSPTSNTGVELTIAGVKISIEGDFSSSVLRQVVAALKPPVAGHD